MNPENNPSTKNNQENVEIVETASIVNLERNAAEMALETVGAINEDIASIPDSKTSIQSIESSISLADTSRAVEIKNEMGLETKLHGLDNDTEIAKKEAVMEIQSIIGEKNGDSESALESGTDSRGIDFVFEQNPEIEKIGTKQQYGEYIGSLFPNSTFKEVVYHGSPSNTIEKFNEDRREGHVGIYFSRSLDGAKNYARSWDGTEKVYPVILDVKNSKTLDGKQYSSEEYNKIQMIKEKPIDCDAIFYDNAGGINDEIAVFNADQVHILGNGRDIEGFKAWIDEKGLIVQRGDIQSQNG